MANIIINNGKKLPKHYDDPIDIFLVDQSTKIDPYFKKIGMTPNLITTLSLIFGLLSVYFYYLKNYLVCGLCWFVSYFFDCMDGNFARKYKMTSEYGDLYDHISDISVGILLLYFFIKNKTVLVNFKIIVSIIFVVLILLTSYYLGCQEEYTKKENKNHLSTALNFVTPHCDDTTKLKTLRYFGPGMINMVIIFIILAHYIFVRK